MSVVITGHDLVRDDLVRVARAGETVRLDAAALAHMRATRDVVDERLAALTHESYAEYRLEFHRVRRLEGDGGFLFEPYDPVPDAPTTGPQPIRTPASSPTSSPRLRVAPS